MINEGRGIAISADVMQVSNTLTVERIFLSSLYLDICTNIVMNILSSRYKDKKEFENNQIR